MFWWIISCLPKIYCGRPELCAQCRSEQVARMRYGKIFSNHFHQFTPWPWNESNKDVPKVNLPDLVYLAKSIPETIHLKLYLETISKFPKLLVKIDLDVFTKNLFKVSILCILSKEWHILISDAGRWKTLGGPVLMVGIICPPPVGIGSTDLPNIGGTSGPPGPPGSRHHWSLPFY